MPNEALLENVRQVRSLTLRAEAALERNEVGFAQRLLEEADKYRAKVNRTLTSILGGSPRVQAPASPPLSTIAVR